MLVLLKPAQHTEDHIVQLTVKHIFLPLHAHIMAIMTIFQFVQQQLEHVLALLMHLVMALQYNINLDVIIGYLVVHTEALVLVTVVKHVHVLIMLQQIFQILLLIHNVIIG